MTNHRSVILKTNLKNDIATESLILQYGITLNYLGELKGKPCMRIKLTIKRKVEYLHISPSFASKEEPLEKRVDKLVFVAKARRLLTI